MTEGLRHTPLYAEHIKSGGQFTEFNGWEMPLQYQDGIFQEHLATRKKAGLFDIGHMGCFAIKGQDALSFIQYATTNNASALQVGQSQYTLLADEHGGAIDDAYLYRFFEDGFILVVNAANHEKDRQHLNAIAEAFQNVIIQDIGHSRTLLSLQGPLSEQILANVIGKGGLPEAHRNALSIFQNKANDLWLARIGYTGEPIGFELFVTVETAPPLWLVLVAHGACPAGLGARDTLRLEAGLPLYGHELGNTIEGEMIPIFAMSSARFAVSFSPEKGNYLGRSALEHQFRDLNHQTEGARGPWSHLPQRIRVLQILDKGIARSGAPVFREKLKVGNITSGTMVPYWLLNGEGPIAAIASKYQRRAIAMALVDSDILPSEIVQIEIQGKRARAVIMPHLLRKDTPPYARPVLPEIPYL